MCATSASLSVRLIPSEAILNNSVQQSMDFSTIDPDVRAIVSSGYSNDPVIANYQDHGFQGVIVKPYRLAELNEVVASVLGE